MINLALLVIIVSGITEAIKRAKVIEKKFTPIVALLIALILALVTHHIGGQISDALILGITAGLVSCGLWSGSKNVIQGIKAKVKK